MAITKILHQKESPDREPGLHTKQLIKYILNPAKTEECILTGSINCLSDTAYEQMVDTKKMFGKTGGRQSYHIIISLVPGEGTPEQLYEMTEKFVEEFLKGEYEVVFAIHTDHEHLHSHIVFNSVNMVTGKKFQYKKGDWKYKMQPITNKLSEEYGLEIMPAEYSREPQNMSRDQWERERNYSEYIIEDAKYCMLRAESRERYIYLLRELGYEVKDGEHIDVKAKGMKRFKRLGTIVPKLDDFTGDNRIYKTGKKKFIKKANLTPLQKKYYKRLYKLRLIEHRRFTYKSALFYKNLQTFKRLQEDYLFLVSENIASIDDLYRLSDKAWDEIWDISNEQKRLYKEHARLRKKFEYSENYEEISLYEEKYKNKLTELKNMKHELSKKKAIAKRIIEDCLFYTMSDLDKVDISDEEIEQDIFEEEELIPGLPMKKEEDNEIDAIEDILGVKEYHITLSEFMNLSIEDKAAIWNAAEYSEAEGIKILKRMSTESGIVKSFSELSKEYKNICAKCLEYESEPWMRWYRQKRLKGEDVFNEDKNLVRKMVR